jgi:hypothetical protein
MDVTAQYRGRWLSTLPPEATGSFAISPKTIPERTPG